MSSDGIFPRIGRGITKTRNFVVNTIFILILLAIFGSIFNSTESISIPEEAALVLDPSGILVEERTFSNPLDDVWNINYDAPEVEIAELIRAIKLAEGIMQFVDGCSDQHTLHVAWWLLDWEHNIYFL